MIEFAGLGPAPFAAMLLADMGATVTRIARPEGTNRSATPDAFLDRGRVDLALDLKQRSGREAALDLIRESDALVEGFRPGTMERLGVGPADAFRVNPRIVYGRMTGWGQDGPLAHTAGHDINFLALTGLLSLIGYRDRPPVPPLNLICDFGGGGMYLALGIVCSILQARQEGVGQVVDASMVHGATHLASFIHAQAASGRWVRQREANHVDGGAPFYRVYETKDAKYVAVGAIESAYFANLVRGLGADPNLLARQWERESWPAITAVFTEIFRTRTRDEWSAHFDRVEACVTPVLSIDEAHGHPQMRHAFIERGAYLEPAAAPRFIDAGKAAE